MEVCHGEAFAFQGSLAENPPGEVQGALEGQGTQVLTDHEADGQLTEAGAQARSAILATQAGASRGALVLAVQVQHTSVGGGFERTVLAVSVSASTQAQADEDDAAV